MAEVFPSLDAVSRLKVKPTAGETHLLDYLSKHLDDDHDVYFQPFFNGDMPDIIISKRNAGITIIEVKDWKLPSYFVDSNNKWHEAKGGSQIRSPFQQVFGYKSNMFRLHVSGLAEKNALNKNFYGVIKVFVFFFGSTKRDIDELFRETDNNIKCDRNKFNSDYKNKSMSWESYNKKMDYLDRKQKQINRDRGLSICEHNIDKLTSALDRDHILFTSDVYREFKRYLTPPHHTISQGIDLEYSKRQLKLIDSVPVHQKIKGVAGSGKTTVLAKRAVNAHIRTQDRVLVLTFNKTLRNYIRDRVSDVREEFSWGMFGITNYHSFITQELNTCGIQLQPPEDRRERSDYFSKIYSDESLFDDHKDDLTRYKCILIDEVQDYLPEWVKIIRKYFLEEKGEMVLFGDFSQNIYERKIDKLNSSIAQGFGRWEKLNKSFRSKDNAPVVTLANAFQKQYLLAKYDIDLAEVNLQQSSLALSLLESYTYDQSAGLEAVYGKIRELSVRNDIHPNDITIISSNISDLRIIDRYLRDDTNEKTQTTFESEEVYFELEKACGGNKTKLMQDLEDIRSSKKFAFNLNSGLTKLSTIHSFKGLESQTCFLIISDEDSEEIIYTGITRAKENLIIFIQGTSKFVSFFEGSDELSLSSV